MMLQVNCIIVQKLKDKIEGLKLDDITFHGKGLHALIMDVAFDGDDGEKAKGLLSGYLRSLPEMGSRMLSVKLTDDQGNIIL
ncbi:MAG: hypothetical protein IJM15_04055 [Erysipelotrichaceae bacterium]|nr:hypothetical protein [Erysipelotrichaceae bacterium]